MRVIAGSARGRLLSVPAGDRVRPTADRVKEALFSSLTSRFGSFDKLTALDLFAGSGSLGIESLSRGADSVVFIDSSLESLQFIRKNLQLTGFTDKAEVIRADAVAAVKILSAASRQFDIIVADPPYAAVAICAELSEAIVTGNLLRLGGVLVIESARKADITIPAGLVLSTKKVYGDTALNFLELAQPKL